MEEEKTPLSMDVVRDNPSYNKQNSEQLIKEMKR